MSPINETTIGKDGVKGRARCCKRERYIGRLGLASPRPWGRPAPSGIITDLFRQALRRFGRACAGGLTPGRRGDARRCPNARPAAERLGAGAAACGSGFAAPAEVAGAFRRQGLLRPQFDIVRIEPTGEAVIAGHSAPKAKVAVTDHGQVVAEADADESGQFVMLPPPFAPGRARSWPDRASSATARPSPRPGSSGSDVPCSRPQKPAPAYEVAAAIAASARERLSPAKPGPLPPRTRFAGEGSNAASTRPAPAKAGGSSRLPCAHRAAEAVRRQERPNFRRAFGDGAPRRRRRNFPKPMSPGANSPAAPAPRQHRGPPNRL